MQTPLLELVTAHDLPELQKSLSKAQPEDIAQLLTSLPEPERLLVLQLLDSQTAAAVFELLTKRTETGGSSALSPKDFLTPETVDLLLAERQFRTLHELFVQTNPVDIARLLSNLPPEEAVVAFRLLPKDSAVGAFEQLESGRQQALLEAFTDQRARTLVSAMSPDDRTRLLDEVPAMVAFRLLRLLPPHLRETTQTLLGYPDQSAGRLMTPDFVDLRRTMTVVQALERIRSLALDKETIYYAYVTDSERHLLGTVSLKDIVLAQPEAIIGDIMKPESKSVSTLMDQEQVARVFRDYDLLAVPVVDSEDRLVGIVTWDDVLDVIEAEATEDIHRMAGLGVKERANTPILESATRRVPWLAFNMAWAFAGAAIINVFEGTLSQVVALAVFMPMIAGQAGNAGIQTATIVVRSMALGDFERLKLSRLMLKEWGVGLIKGTIFGFILGVVVWLMKRNVALAEITGGALFLNMLVASTAGVLIPVTLRRFGVDPASVAGVFDTMLTDFMGFLIYLGLATIFIGALLSAR